MQIPKWCGLLVAALMVLSLTGCSEERDRVDVVQPPGPESTTVDFPGGGEIEFPPGALPDGATVTVETAPAPPLPPGIELAGDAVRVEVTGAVLVRPAVVRLPVPTGIRDERTLVVFQVEDDGTQLLLSGEIDGGLIVAHSPGFGQSSLLGDLRARMKTTGSSSGRLVTGVVLGEVDEIHLPELSPPTPAPITGPGFIGVGGVATYVLSLHLDKEQTSWAHTPGNLAVAETPPWDHPMYYSIRAQQTGLVDVMVDYVGGHSGIRGFSSRTVSIQSEIESGEDGLYIGLTPPDPSVGSGFGFYATTSGTPVVAWAWDFGDGTTGNQAADSVTDKELLVNHVYQSVGPHTVSVSATFESGATLTSTGVVRVTDEGMRVLVSGPDRFEPTSSGETQEYRAHIFGGEPAYDASWRLYPGNQSGETQGSGYPPMTYDFSFVEPGSYYLSVDLTDATGETAHVTRLVTVKKVTDLAAEIAVAPNGGTTPNSDYTATISITGGILVVNGAKKSYDVEIHWGDGDTESATVESPTGPPEGSVQFSHTYDEDGSYDVYAVVSDGVGDQVDTDVITIEVDNAPALPFTDCRVTLRVIGDIETIVDGQPSTTTSARRYLSNWAEGGFTGNTFTGTYEEEIFNTTGSIEITLNDAGDLVESYQWTHESETTGGVIVTTASGTGVPLHGNPSAGIYKIEGEATCGAITTLEDYSNGTNPHRLTAHRCDRQSSIEIAFMER